MNQILDIASICHLMDPEDGLGYSPEVRALATAGVQILGARAAEEPERRLLKQKDGPKTAADFLEDALHIKNGKAQEAAELLLVTGLMRETEEALEFAFCLPEAPEEGTGPRSQSAPEPAEKPAGSWEKEMVSVVGARLEKAFAEVKAAARNQVDVDPKTSEQEQHTNEVLRSRTGTQMGRWRERRREIYRP